MPTLVRLASPLLAACLPAWLSSDSSRALAARADHVSGAVLLKEKYHAPVCIGENIRLVQAALGGAFNLKDLQTDGSQFDILWKDDQTFNLGHLVCRVLYTPGHTPACVSYYFVDDCVFVGDTVRLLIHSIDRSINRTSID